MNARICRLASGLALMAAGCMADESDHVGHDHDQSDVVPPVDAAVVPPVDVCGPDGRHPAAATEDPTVVGSWSPLRKFFPGVSGLHAPIIAVHTHVLPTGKVLFWTREGGDHIHGPDVSDGVSQYVFEWDPVQDTFQQKPHPTSNVFCAGHAFDAEGRLVTAGGHGGELVGGVGVGLSQTSLYTGGQWSVAPSMSFARWYPTVTTDGSGEQIVLNGEDSDGLPVTSSEVWNGYYWRTLGISTAGFAHDYPRTALAPDGRILVSDLDHASSHYVMTAGNGAVAPGPTPVAARRLSAPLVSYAPGKVLVVGGNGDVLNAGGPNDVTSSAEMIDLGAPVPAWRAVASMQHRRWYHNAVALPDGDVLVVGGTSTEYGGAGTAVYQAELYDPEAGPHGAWSAMATMCAPRMYHSTAVLLPDGRVLAAGGGMPGLGADPAPHDDMQIYSPPYLFRGPRPVVTAAPAAIGYGESFAMTTAQASRIRQVSAMALPSVTHSFDMNQRRIPLAFTAAGDHLTVTAPAHGNIAPPGFYMVFIIDDNGVPSVASFIKLKRAMVFGVNDWTPTAVDAGQAAGRAWADINLDGKRDFCRVTGASNLGDSRVRCSLSTGSGLVAERASAVIDWGKTSGRAWTDVNGDGRADYCRLVGATNLISSRVACNLSTATGFTGTIQSPVLDWGIAQHWVDVNADGRADFCRIVSGNQIACTLSTLQPGGSGGFGAQWLAFADPGQAEGRTWVDADGNGSADFCRVMAGGTTVGCTLSAAAGFGSTVVSSTLDVGYSFGRTWADVDGDGRAAYCRLTGGGNGIGSHVACSPMRVTPSGLGFAATITSGVIDWGNADQTFADVDGSGRADFCRLTGAGAQTMAECTRMTAHGWGETHTSTAFEAGAAGSRTFADVDGNGTRDLCRLVPAGSLSSVQCTVVHRP